MLERLTNPNIRSAFADCLAEIGPELYTGKHINIKTLKIKNFVGRLNYFLSCFKLVNVF